MSCMNKGVLDGFCVGKTLRSCYWWSEQFVAGTKMSDESPTDQEHRFGDRTDQSYRVQLTMSLMGSQSISIFFLVGSR